MDLDSSFSFPVIRGTQANREHYIAVWSFSVLRRLTVFDDASLPARLRAERTISRSRIPEMTAYMLDNPNTYVFSGITASIDSQVYFEPLHGQQDVGVLRVPLSARFVVNDGQHRRAAIIDSLEKRPELGNETIPVVLIEDIGLKLCSTIYRDLNRSSRLDNRERGLRDGIRTKLTDLSMQVVSTSELFGKITDIERTSLAKGSSTLFTLSAFSAACYELMRGIGNGDMSSDAELAQEYWEAVAEYLPGWQDVGAGKMRASAVREAGIHSHGLLLQAIGRIGNALLHDYRDEWRQRLAGLRAIDWSRANKKLWEGRAIIRGRVTNTKTGLTLTTNTIKEALNLPLDAMEQEAENSFGK